LNLYDSEYYCEIKSSNRKIFSNQNKETKNKNLIDNIMAKSKDSRKNVKKEAAKTPKEKKAEKRLKKSKKD